MIRVYDDPFSIHIVKEIDVYNVYYIYKEENNRVLLGTSDFINQSTVKETIIGWVENTFIYKWKNKLALECNWEDPAYSIRKSNENRRIYGFADQPSQIFILRQAT